VSTDAASSLLELVFGKDLLSRYRDIHLHNSLGTIPGAEATLGGARPMLAAVLGKCTRRSWK
jgi:hypothetical protein